jgi:hypothetical protein
MVWGCWITKTPSLVCLLKKKIIKKATYKFQPSQVWWHTPVIPALRRLRLEDHEFEASYIVS